MGAVLRSGPVIDDIADYVVRRLPGPLRRGEGEIVSRSHRWSIPLMLVTMLLVLGAVPSIGRAQDQKVELRIWDQFTEETSSKAADAIYKSFTDQHPNITIKREVVSS